MFTCGIPANINADTAIDGALSVTGAATIGGAATITGTTTLAGSTVVEQAVTFTGSGRTTARVAVYSNTDVTLTIASPNEIGNNSTDHTSLTVVVPSGPSGSVLGVTIVGGVTVGAWVKVVRIGGAWHAVSWAGSVFGSLGS